MADAHSRLIGSAEGRSGLGDHLVVLACRPRGGTHLPDGLLAELEQTPLPHRLRLLFGFPQRDGEPLTRVAVSQKRAHWQREVGTASAFFGFDRARNLNDFEAALALVVTSHNFLYADTLGNIAYWQAGQVPLRPSGSDPRLPLLGDGSAEWPGGIRERPRSINPARGYLANWNNKPAVDFDNADSVLMGKQFRLRDIEDRLATGAISLETMRDVPKDIARVKSLGREARFLKPYLVPALTKTPPVHPLAPAARAILDAWDGSYRGRRPEYDG